MTRFAAIKQGHIKIVDISIVCNFTVDKCELNPAYVIKNIDSPKDLLNGQINILRHSRRFFKCAYKALLPA
ncbi:hypothetical protein E8P15_09370, partial [Escherichia coli]